MRSVGAAAVAVILLGAAAACGNQTAIGPSTTSSSSSSTSTTTTTTLAPTTTPAPSTTLPPTTTTTSTTTVPATTTTLAPGAALTLRADGLGSADFGAEPEGVLAYVSAIVGPPTADSGWIDALSLGACPGDQIRIVAYEDLSLFFSENAPLAPGRRAFISYLYGPPLGGPREPINPAGPRTAGGAVVGSTVAALRAAHPEVQVFPGDELVGPNFLIEEGLHGYLDGTADDSVVTAFVGGFGCGE